MRSIVLYDAVGTPGQELFWRDKTRIAADGRSIRSTCELAPACAADLPDPNAPVDWVVRRLRANTLTGQSLDADGQPHQLAIDPQWFLLHLYDNVGGPFLVFGQLPAASEALREHDPVPLLRLAANNDFPELGDGGDPNLYLSLGANVATFCADNLFPWSQGAPLALRQEQWSNAVDLQPNEPYAPFGAGEVLRSEFDEHDECLPWPTLDHPSPIVEPGATYPAVPTVVLEGAQDQTVPLAEASQVARLFHARLVTVQGAPHPTLAYSSPCAASIAAAWIETPGQVDTGCASKPFIVPPDTARFELTASQADLPSALAGNHAPPADLRVARAAADALNDALKQGLMSTTGNSPGLRGGSVETEYGVVWTSTLDGYRFARDTAVSGTSTWNAWNAGGNGELSADLTVDGPDDRDGTLHVSGPFFAPGPAGTLHLTGSIDGRIVNATIPAD